MNFRTAWFVLLTYRNNKKTAFMARKVLKCFRCPRVNTLWPLKGAFSQYTFGDGRLHKVAEKMAQNLFLAHLVCFGLKI